MVWIARHPATAPGTVTGTGPRIGISARPSSAGGSAPVGERPLELIASISPSARCTSANRSPPTPHMWGYATARVTAAWIAASMAVPPRSKAAAPARVAASCGVAIAHDEPSARSAIGQVWQFGSTVSGR